MKRSPSMEQAVPILPEISVPADNYQNSQIHQTSPFSTTSFSPRLAHSESSSSLLSPRSAVSYDFSFLNDSPGIRLVSSDSELLCQPEASSSSIVEWADRSPGMADSDHEHADSSAQNNRASLSAVLSLESLDDDEHSTSSLSRTVENTTTSHPALYSDEMRMASLSSIHQRSLSADAISSDQRKTENSFRGSMDEGLGTIGSRTDLAVSSPESEQFNGQDSQTSSNSLQYKLVGESSFTSPELPRADMTHVSDKEQECMDDAADNPGTPFPDSQIPMERVFEFVDRGGRVQTDLPAITEESEHGCHLSSGAHAVEVPEPSELAPGAVCSPIADFEWDYNAPASSSSVPPVYHHRRVVSDDPVDYSLTRTRELDDSALTSHSKDMTNEENEVNVRSRASAGRSSSSTMANRCKSQVMLQRLDREAGGIGFDRSLSTSDPALNGDDEQREEARDEHEKAAGVPVAPPPVLISRKNSSAQPGSWQRFFNPAGVAPHNVVTPTTANLNSTRSSISRTNTVVDSKPDRSRIDKKQKDKGDTFSFGTWLGRTGKKKSGERPSLDNVLNGYASRAGHPPVSASLPARRGVNAERPSIPKFTEGLPDNISRVFSPTGTPEGEDGSQSERFEDLPTVLLENAKWSRLDLFTEDEYNSWHDKFRHDKMSHKAVKKQDAIYELIMIEKQHCANLAFLQQGYRVRLIEENILSTVEVDRLVPDVIDALLVFHCNLLEHLLNRQKENDEVETISDILARELSEEGAHSAVCVNAYTTFGAAKEKSELTFNSLKLKNSKFADFIKRIEQDRMYRKFEFKATMTKVIGRPTKYGLLVESIARCEGNKFTKAAEVTEKALQAAKRFALRIDNNLMVAQLAKRWEDVRVHTDTSSWTNIYIPDKTVPNGMVKLRWTFDDVCSKIGESGRKLMCLGDVSLKVPQSGGNYKLQSVFLTLFDDILVCLVRKASRYFFAMQEQAVLPVSSLILRTAGRGQSIMLASGVKPTLLEFEFLTKADMNKWTKMLDNAINVSPMKVRLSPRNEGEAAHQLALVHELEEKKIREAEELWLKRLQHIFADRAVHEQALCEYMASRMKFIDEVRNHVSSLPLRGRPELLDRVREAVRNKFKELRLVRTVPLSKLMDDMTRAREAELWSYFDDRADIGDGGDSDGSASDSSGSGRGTRPRRIKTFNGAPSDSTAPRDKPYIRRHTTVPRMGASNECPDNDCVAEEEEQELHQIDSLVHQLPLTQPLPARRECRKLIKHLSRLKSENIALKNEVALDKLRIATLERTRTMTGPVVTPGETMEMLRKKEKEVREDEARRRIDMDELEKELEQRTKEFMNEKLQWEEQKEQQLLELHRSEAELANKWAAIKEVEGRGDAVNGGRQRSSVGTPTRTYLDSKASPVVQELSPALKNLTVKSETKRKK